MEWREKVLTKVCNNLLNGIKLQSILDIGGGQSELKNILKPKFYININKEGYGEDWEKNFVAKEYWLTTPDVKLDLNKIKKLPMKSKKFDLVALCHILEHLNFEAMKKIIEESQRVSKKYILVGLPNELLWYNRLRILFGKNTIGVTQFGHHYMFDLKEADKFIKRFKKFKLIKKMYVGKKIPPIFRPSVTAFEIYYLLARK